MGLIENKLKELEKDGIGSNKPKKEITLNLYQFLILFSIFIIILLYIANLFLGFILIPMIDNINPPYIDCGNNVTEIIEPYKYEYCGLFYTEYSNFKNYNHIERIVLNKRYSFFN